LHCYENDAGDGLSGLRDSEFLDEDEDTNDGESSDNLDENIDDVSALSLVRTVPNEETKHWNNISLELSGADYFNLLRHSMTN
jgi:hypothetical protein